MHHKSRRRRADTSNYIRRRFLYDDDNNNEDTRERSSKSKVAKSQKRIPSQEVKYSTSPLALIAASTTNYQRKRRKNTERSPSPAHSRSPRGRRGRRPRVFSPHVEEYPDDHLPNCIIDPSEDELCEEIEGRLPGSYSHRRSRADYDENSQLIKPVFRRAQKRDSFSPDHYPEEHQVNFFDLFNVISEAI